MFLKKFTAGRDKIVNIDGRVVGDTLLTGARRHWPNDLVFIMGEFDIHYLQVHSKLLFLS